MPILGFRAIAVENMHINQGKVKLMGSIVFIIIFCCSAFIEILVMFPGPQGTFPGPPDPFPGKSLYNVHFLGKISFIFLTSFSV